MSSFNMNDPLLYGTTAKQSWYSHYNNQVASLIKGKVATCVDGAFLALKWGMAFSPLLNLAYTDANQDETTIQPIAPCAVLAAPLILYGGAKALAWIHNKRRHPQDPDEELAPRIRQSIDWAFNPVGNLASAAAFKVINSLQDRIGERACNAAKMIAYQGLRLISPSPWYTISSIVHNGLVSLAAWNPQPASGETEQRDPFNFSLDACTKVLNWKTAEATPSIVGAKEAIPRIVRSNFHNVTQSFAQFGLSLQAVRETMQKVCQRWSAHTRISCVDSEEPPAPGSYDLIYSVDPTLTEAAATTSSDTQGEIWVNPNPPNGGPRWTKGSTMLLNTLVHEFGHYLGLDHCDENITVPPLCRYSIMHSGPRWEPAIKAPDVPESDIVAAEKLIGVTPGRKPGVVPVIRKFCTDAQFVFWRLFRANMLHIEE